MQQISYAHFSHVGHTVSIYLDAHHKGDSLAMDQIERRVMDVAATLAGTANEFHNACVELAQENCYDFAITLLEIAVQRYPKNTDVCADVIQYGMKTHSLDDLKKYYDGDETFTGLKNIPKRLWTWRAFSFSLDYLVECLKEEDELSDHYKTIQTEIESLIVEYKKSAESFSDQSEQERAYMAACEYKQAIGKSEEAYKELREAVEKLPNRCPQCALTLADYYFEQAQFESTVKYAQLAIDSVGTQEAISVGYAYYILAISLQRIENSKGGTTTTERAKPIFKAYHKAYEYLRIDGRTSLCKTLQKRVRAMEIDTDFSSGIDFKDDEKKRSRCACCID